MLSKIAALYRIYRMPALVLGGAMLTSASVGALGYWHNTTGYKAAADAKKQAWSEERGRTSEQVKGVNKDKDKAAPPAVLPAASNEPIDLIPSEYYPAAYKEPSPPPVPDKVYTQDMLFVPTNNNGEPQSKIDLRNQYRYEREQSRGKVVYVNYTEEGAKYDIKNLDAYLNQDENFEKHETVQDTHATYPVDLTRVVPVTKLIPAVLYSEIDSELASENVKAFVEQDVLGYHGQKILIPKGTWVVGRYKPLKRFGDTRIAIEWYRLLTPDGINIELVAKGTDAEGKEGLTGDVDNKLFEKYGMAILLATINTAAQMSVDVQNTQQQAAAGAFTQGLGDVTAQAIGDSINIAPTVRIPKGTRIQIQPLVDIWFREPRGKLAKATPVDSRELQRLIKEKQG
jgi:type IV secretory pathway VirB10-like protein